LDLSWVRVFLSHGQQTAMLMTVTMSRVSRARWRQVSRERGRHRVTIVLL
jgi:hypothetical protein